MNIFGKEYNFFFGVGAYDEITKLCRDNDLNNVGELLQGSSGINYEGIASVAIIMNRAHEDLQKFVNPDYAQNYLTKEVISFLSIPQIGELNSELAKAITEGTQTSVEVEEAPNKGKNVVSEGEQ